MQIKQQEDPELLTFNQVNTYQDVNIPTLSKPSLKEPLILQEQDSDQLNILLKSQSREIESAQVEQLDFHEGRWDKEQLMLLHLFLELNSKIFVARMEKKDLRIFRNMMDSIGTRSIIQCRGRVRQIEKTTKHFIGTIIHLRNTHFHTTDPQPVINQLERRKIPITEKIPTIAQLKDWYKQAVEFIQKAGIRIYKKKRHSKQLKSILNSKNNEEQKEK